MDYPPLLAQGLHPRNWTELHDLCATGFPLSQSRATLLAGLRAIVDRLCAENIVGDLWVDGSLLTQKLEPSDVDFVLILQPQVYLNGTPGQRAMIEWLGTRDVAVRAQTKHDYGCDTYICFDTPPGHPLYPGRDMRQYWQNQFGNDRSSSPKGIAVLMIPGGVQ